MNLRHSLPEMPLRGRIKSPRCALTPAGVPVMTRASAGIYSNNTDAEILAAAIAFVKAREQGINSQAFYRRLRRAWIAKVRPK